MRAFCKIAAATLGVAIASHASGLAQNLQRVSVTSFALSSDVAHPRAGTPFHLVVTLRVLERVRDVQNVQLPLLAGLQVLGDVRSVAADTHGTTYREVLTVAAQRGGAMKIAPATFDAIDARDGKAKEYATNALALDVAGDGGGSRSAVLAARLLVSLGVGMMVLGLGLALALRRRRPAAAPVELAQPVPVEREREPGDLLRDALARLESDPTRAGAVEARGLLWRMVGGSDGETLADVMIRARHLHPNLLPALSVLERAAFTFDSDLPAALLQARSTLRSLT